MIIVKERYVEIEIPDEPEDTDKSENIYKEDIEKEYLEKDIQLEKDLQIPLEKIEKDIQLEKDLQIPLEKIEKDGNSCPKILMDIASRLGKMLVQDIAYDVNYPRVN